MKQRCWRDYKRNFSLLSICRVRFTNHTLSTSFRLTETDAEKENKDENIRGGEEEEENDEGEGEDSKQEKGEKQNLPDCPFCGKDFR